MDVEGFARVGVVVGRGVDGLVVGVFGRGAEDPAAKCQHFRHREDLRGVKEGSLEGLRGKEMEEGSAYRSAEPVSMKRLPV